MLKRWLPLAKQLLLEPTSPLIENLPQAFVRRFVTARPELSLREDAAGNLLVKYPARPSKNAAMPLVMVAHLDHPGFHVKGVSDTQLRLRFMGWVRPPHARAGQRLRIFRPGQTQSVGLAQLTAVAYHKGRLDTARAKLLSGSAAAGDFTMWDFPAFAVKGGKIVARSCDDNLGAAAALCALDEIARRKPKGVAFWALLTRSEEIGWLGTLEAIRLKTLPKTSCILSLETSQALPHAPQGAGVIVRVGDRASIFDPQLTGALEEAAKRAEKRLKGFRFQRKLMDGGTCEATPFCAAGYRASALALPLGNYHNQSFDAKNRASMGPENVCVRDFEHEIRLLVELALHPESLKRDAASTLRSLLKDRSALARRLLRKRG